LWGKTVDSEVRDTQLPVDFIRTVAIVLVILLHAAIEPVPIVNTVTQQEVTRWIASNIYNSLARPCVSLFIILSGALLLQPSKIKEPLRVFFKKRLNRIALPFIFWGAAFFTWDIFVNHDTFSVNFIAQGILTGPYNHFWFLYMLVGLYLLTPVLRIVVGYADWKVVRYFFVIWFLGTSIVPLFGLFGLYSLNLNVFPMVGCLGYFLLGAYLPKIRIRSPILYATLFIGFAWTIIGTYAAAATVGGTYSLYFYDYLTANVVLASASLFMLLLKVPVHIRNPPIFVRSCLIRSARTPYPFTCFT
jgi:surface polysaccharide O-acyltransferase-like enzyme